MSIVGTMACVNGRNAVSPPPSGATVGWLRSVLKDVPGNPIAKAFVESALLDAQLRRHGMPLVDFLGAAPGRIPVGVSVGIPDSIDDRAAEIARKRWVSLAGLDEDKRTRRVVGMLARKGYSPSNAFAVVKDWQRADKAGVD